ncbi:MAG: helix-turn-helix domain-containing protein [Candidatus Moranbacteria bacterium]|nr:helix-turn-helix domain-containing protein [Candidatus Moranbacteria bacterium]
MINEQLRQFGLSEAQAEVYAALLSFGIQKAGEIAKRVAIKRGLVYRVLEDLEKMSLVVKQNEVGKPSTFSPRHPEMLRTHIEERLRKAKEAEILFTGAAPMLGSAFNLISGKPSIRVLEGIEGFRDLHRDILAEGKPIKLIRSIYDRENEEIAKFIDKQIKEQVRHEIHAQVLTHETPKAIGFTLAGDTERLVTRMIITDREFRSPAQIVIYGNKVGITDFQGSFITTIIENEAIRGTLDMMFDSIWRASEKGHAEIIRKYQEKDGKNQMYNPNFK